jgi:hypothetical protein
MDTYLKKKVKTLKNLIDSKMIKVNIKNIINDKKLSIIIDGSVQI